MGKGLVGVKMRRVTRFRSSKSSAWRSIGGGKSTWRVVRRALWEEGSDFKGLLGVS